jgi:Na+-transporting methylmalonyl-CoA/oxaloacetate decarboxylase gamma subunit
MGFDNILDHDGLGIAATGMIIVFAALTLISIFIGLLPRILESRAIGIPPESPPQGVSLPVSTSDNEVAAAIGFVMHQIDVQKKRKS